MTDSPPNALTCTRAVPSTSPIASMLRRMLAWMDSRNTITVSLPLPVEKKPEVVPEPDDGILKPEDIADRVAALMWAHRGAIEVSLDYDDDLKSRHSEHEPETRLRLPDDIRVTIPHHKVLPVVVTAPDGQSQSLEQKPAIVILQTWACIQALAIVDTLGLEDILPGDISDDGAEPSPSLPDRLAEAVGIYVEQRVPTQCTETYVTRHTGENGVRTEMTHPSRWQHLGENVLLKIDTEIAYRGQPDIAPGCCTRPSAR